MNSRTRLHLAIATSLGVAALLPGVTHAHRGWMLPSATVVSGDNAWVTIDAAISNDLFYFEHNAMRLDNLQVLAPDGRPIEAQNKATGRYRSTFDVKLDAPGTYRISMVNDNANASFKVGNETKRLRGTIESLRKEIPAGATEVSVRHNQNRIDVFVTSGKPTDTALKPTGSGLELVPYTHPNDLVAGEDASFGLVIDGKPAAGVPVTLIPGGIRYRDQLGEIKVVTGSDGRFKVTWPKPGMYWLNASYPPRAESEEEEGAQGGGAGPNRSPGAAATGPGARATASQGGPGTASGPGAGPGAGRREPPGGTLDAPARRSAYTATLEVLAP